MKKSFLLLAVMVSIVIIALLHSCVKEEHDLDKMAGTPWNPNIAIPLIYSKLSIRDILKDVDTNEVIIINEATGFLAIVYRDTLFSEKASDVIPCPLCPPIWELNNYAWPITLTLPLDSLELNLEIYDKVTGGNFYFEDPKIKIHIVNSFGVSVDTLIFTTFEAYSPINGILPIELNGYSIPPDAFIPINPLPPSPTVAGQSADTVYIFDKINSNIIDVLALSPRYIHYAIRTVLNNPLNTPNFITDSSMFSVEVEVELPLWGYADNIILQDTTSFEFDITDPSGSDVDVEYATFNLNVYNGFPVDVFLQLYFMDSTLTILDSLIYDADRQIMSSGIIGPEPDLKVIQSTHKLTTIYVNNTEPDKRLDKISLADQLIINAVLTTPNAGTSSLIKFYADYTLEIKLSVRAQLKSTF